MVGLVLWYVSFVPGNYIRILLTVYRVTGSVLFSISVGCFVVKEW